MAAKVLTCSSCENWRTKKEQKNVTFGFGCWRFLKAFWCVYFRFNWFIGVR